MEKDLQYAEAVVHWVSDDTKKRGKMVQVPSVT